MRMLAGIESTSKNPAGSIRLLTGPLSNANVWNIAGATATAPAHGLSSGYHFSGMAPSATNNTTEAATEMYYDGVGPTGTTLVTALDVSATTTQNANQGERAWAAAAVPQEWGNTGRRVFCISVDGQLRSPADPNVQNSIYGTSTAAIANGTKPGGGAGAANAKAIATMVGTSAVTAVGTYAVTMMDGATFNGLPIYAK
jgi:hypothetical protein